MVILEENEGYSQIIGSSSAPYLNGLATTYASATNWYAVQHNSPHDYLDLIVGSDLGLPSGQPYSVTTLVDELHAGGIPSQAYMESMPSNCAKGSSSNGLYDTNHNPFVHFTKYSSSSGGWCSSADLSSEGVVPYPGSGGLVSALNGANAPDFVFLVPNDCDEMHGDTSSGSPCASSSNSQLIKAGDTWLSSNLAPVLSSAWFQENGIIIITWDEAANGDRSGCCGLSSPGGHVATIVVAAGNKGMGKFTATGDHYGTLRAIEETYGVGFLGGSGNSAHGDLSGAFGSAPTTGSITGTVTDAQTTAGVAGATVTCTCATGGITTGAGGSYAFSNVTPGSNYSLTFSDTGYVGQTVNNVAVAAGKATTKNAALTEDGSIGGQVTDTATQLPIANATVTCTCHSGSATTDGAGNYAFSNVTPANNYNMTVSANGYSPRNINNVVVNAGQKTTENLALSGTPGSITGVVSDGTAASHPVLANVNVTCTCKTASVATDGTGSYSFTNVTPGSYSLTFTDLGYTTLTVNNVGVFASAQTAENASLSEDGSVTGVVTDGTAGDNPVLAGVTVTCTCQVGSASTDGTGSYTFSDVTPGTYSLTFTDPGFVPLSVSGLSVTAGTQTTQGASLIEGGSITGIVSDGTASGTPVVGGAEVTCTCQGGSVSTDGTGSYTFSDIALGAYSLTFTDPGFVSQTINNVGVIAGTQTTENASLTEDGIITGTVTDAGTHQAISNATVTCTCQAAAVATNAAGVYDFSDVTPASYTLTITAGGYVGQGSAPFTVSPGLAATEDFQLTALASPLNVVQKSRDRHQVCEQHTLGYDRHRHGQRRPPRDHHQGQEQLADHGDRDQRQLIRAEHVGESDRSPARPGR